MDHTQTVRSNTATTSPQLIIHAPEAPNTDISRVLRNTYALLAMTLLFSAGVAATSLALRLPAPGIILTLAGYFGLLFAVYHLKNSGWALPAVFALTGFMGYTLGPVLSQSLALPGGGQVVTMALAATGATFLALSAWALTARRDFSFMGGFLFAGMVIALLAGLAGRLSHGRTAFSGPDSARDQSHRARRRNQLCAGHGGALRLDF